MKIGPRYSEEHTHSDKMCVTSHKRNINNKVFLFIAVNTPKHITTTVTLIDQIGIRRHLLHA